MKFLFTIFSIVLITTTTLSQTVVITDTGFKGCLVNGYSSLLDGNDDLIIDSAAVYTGNLGCSSKGISDVSVLEYFPMIDQLYLANNSISDASSFVYLDSIETIYAAGNTISETPDLTGLTKLTTWSMEDNLLTGIENLPTTIEVINVGNNRLEGGLDLSSYTQLKRVMAYYNELTLVQGYTSNANIEVLQFQHNNITSIESFGNLPLLRTINIGFNSIQSIEGTSSLPALQIMRLSNNSMTDLPIIDLSNTPEIWLEENRLSFDDLMQFKDWSSKDTSLFVWTQHASFPSKSVDVVFNSSFTLESNIDDTITTNTFNWFHDADVLVGETSHGVKLDIVDLSHEGNYWFYTTNPNFPGAIVRSDTVWLDIVHNHDESEPFAFSPNGDGVADFFEVEQEGEVSVYNAAGEKVKTITGPTFWDGSNESGQTLDYGYYILVTAAGEKIGVSIAR